MRLLVSTPKFKRAFGKFVKRNADLQLRIEDTLGQMEIDVFAPKLGTHKLSGKLDGLQSCSFTLSDLAFIVIFIANPQSPN